MSCVLSLLLLILFLHCHHHHCYCSCNHCGWLLFCILVTFFRSSCTVNTSDFAVTFALLFVASKFRCTQVRTTCQVLQQLSFFWPALFSLGNSFKTFWSGLILKIGAKKVRLSTLPICFFVKLSHLLFTFLSSFLCQLSSQAQVSLLLLLFGDNVGVMLLLLFFWLHHQLRRSRTIT
jgi:hypothetical protein